MIIFKLNLMVYLKKVFYVLALIGMTFALNGQCVLIDQSCNSNGPLGPNILPNGSFEDNALGGRFGGFNPNDAGWNFFGAGFGNIFVENGANPFSPCGAFQPQPQNGSNMVKIFGQFTGGFNASGAFSNPVPVTPGRTYVAGIYMQSPSAATCPIDHIGNGSNFAEVHLEWYNADGDCSFTTSQQFRGSWANGGWYDFSTISVAPDDAVSCQVSYFFFQEPGFDGGAIYYDNAYLQERLDGTGAVAPSLACNDAVNITVGSACEAAVTPDFFLENYDDFTNADLTLEVSFTDHAGNVYNLDDLSGAISSSLTYTVTEICSGNSCWGNVTFEDKTEPTVDCEFCPVGGMGDVDGDGVIDYAPECQLMCYELPLFEEGYWDRLRDNLIPEATDDFADDHTSDNCEEYNEFDISYYDVYAKNGCDGDILQRTFTLTYTKPDGTIGYASCTREYFFTPLDLSRVIEAPFVEFGSLCIPTPVEDTLLLPKKVVEIPTCNVDISPEGIQAFFDISGTEDQDTDDDGDDPPLDVDCVVENNEGTWFAYPHFYIEGRNPTGPHAQAVTSEICNMIVGYTDLETEACAPGCMGNMKVVRTWTILDWCAGDFITYDQVIKLVDDIAPDLSINDVFMSVDPWKCSVDVPVPTPEHLSDNCDDNLTVEVVGIEGGLNVVGGVIRDVPVGTTTVTVQTADCCGNVTKATFTITVEDLTPPVPVVKQNVVTTLTNLGNPVDGDANGIGKIFATDIDNGSYDGCTNVTIEIRRPSDDYCEAQDTLWGDHVVFCCADLGEKEVMFRVTDVAGNENISWATVLVESKVGTSVFCPESMVVTCDMDLFNFDMTGFVDVYGPCGRIDIDIDTQDVRDRTEPRDKPATTPPLYDVDGDGLPDLVPEFNTSCGFGAIRRQFRSDGATICEQWFVVEPIDAFDASTIRFPGDVEVDCDDYDTGEPTWEAPVCNLVGMAMESDTFLFEDGACFKILNHWSVIDWCVFNPDDPFAGGKYGHTQVIKVIDTEDPVVSVPDSLCFAVTQECTSKGVVLTGSAEDNGDCSSDWLAWQIVIDAFADWTEDFTYSTEQPQLTPAGEPNPFHVPKSSNGEEISIVLPDGIQSSKVWHRAVWRAYDGCGNTSSVTRYFQITDKKAPTPYCLNLSTALMSNGQVELWAIDFDRGSFDNCTDSENLLFTFTDVAPPVRCDEEYSREDWYDGTFWYYDASEAVNVDPEDDDEDCPNNGFGEYQDLGDYGGDVHRWEPSTRSSGKVFTAADADANGFVQVPIYVWDECGNKDFCLVNLRLVDNAGGGSARITGSIKTEQGESVENVVTHLDGPINFSMDYMTNVSGEYAFENMPMYTDYMVSGEKNDDYLNGVSTLDIILIQKHILGDELLQSPYQMIAADVNNDRNITALDLIELRKLILGINQALPNNGSWKFVDADQELTTINPWLYDETRMVSDLEEDAIGIDFVGVKVGDVNGSVQLAQSQEIDKRSENIEIVFEDRAVVEGELVELVLKTERTDVYGYQFTMNTTGLSLESVSGTGIGEEHVASHGDKLTMSYGQLSPIAEGEMMVVTMKASVAGQLSEMITLSNTITRSEAYVGSSLEEVNIELRGGEQVGEFGLYQNEPNPFADQTVIGFDLPEAGSAKMTMYDVTGKIIKVIDGDYAKGYNEIRVSQSEINATGLIYYRLETNEHTATRHMIVIE